MVIKTYWKVPDMLNTSYTIDINQEMVKDIIDWTFSTLFRQLLRSSLVNHRIQAKLARELGLDKLINFGSKVCITCNARVLCVLPDLLQHVVSSGESPVL